MDYTQDTNAVSFPFRNHTALLLCAALPYLQPSCRYLVELACKFLELSETLRAFQDASANGTSPFSILHGKQEKDSGFFGLINLFVLDLEGLLKSLSCLCNGSEKETVGMFLNLIRARQFYDTYGELLNSGLLSGLDVGSLFSGNLFFSDNSANVASSSPEGTFKPPHGIPPEAPNFSGLMSMLNDEQKETLSLLKDLFSEDS